MVPRFKRLMTQSSSRSCGAMANSQKITQISKVEGIATNQASKYVAEDIVTVGSKGKISFSTFDAKPIVLTTTNGATEFQIDYPEHIQQPLIQKVVNDLNGTDTSPNNGETAARTTWVMEQILKTYYA